ncbi:uncharacterized protein F5891DRAFT_1206755 [Suillus fuscotomentosus]
MECKPFGVKVMLVTPGQVRTNISANQAATLELFPTSIYKPYFDRVYERLDGTSQGEHEFFAHYAVAEVLNPDPPSCILLGVKSDLFEFLCWFPR